MAQQAQQLSLFGARVGHCPRCGRLCQATGPKNLDARLMRRASDPAAGLCPNCAITDFILSVEPMAHAIEKNGPEILLTPHVQEQFGTLLIIGQADADQSEIDWEVVVKNWHLPFPKRWRKRG